MAIACNASQSRLFLIAAILTAALGGCNSSPSSDYRAINQRAASSPASTETVQTGEPAVADSESVADAMNVENRAMMSIRAEAMTEAADTAVSALEIANPLKVELLVREKTFLKDRRTGALRLTFDDLNLLTVLNMDPVTDDAVTWMPEWMTSLEGHTVRIRGFMLPSFVAEGLESFVLLRDNKVCCYGPTAKVYDNIAVSLKAGTTTNYVPLEQSFDVVGRFKIDLQSADGKVYELFKIEDAAVILR